MRILMLTPYLPYPPTSGGQVRSYNLIKNLASKHKITLFSLVDLDHIRPVRRRPCDKPKWPQAKECGQDLNCLVQVPHDYANLGKIIE